LTALLPPPPTPITLMRAPVCDASSIVIRNGVAGRASSVSCLSIEFGIDDLHFSEVYNV
jgi:hypothetical protein